MNLSQPHAFGNMIDAHGLTGCRHRFTSNLNSACLCTAARPDRAGNVVQEGMPFRLYLNAIRSLNAAVYGKRRGHVSMFIFSVRDVPKDVCGIPARHLTRGQG